MADSAGNADERLIVMLEARISEFEKRMAAAERRGTRTYTGLQRGSARATAAMEADATRAAGRVNQALASVSGRVGVFGKAFLGGLGAGLISSALAGISSDIRSVIGGIADMADVADRLGFTTDELQGLQRGFSMAGVNQEAFNGALEKFVQNIGDAAEGSGTFGQVLQANGIAIKNADGSIRATAEILGDFADLMNRTPEVAAKMALVTEGFGRGGKAMAGAFEGGSVAMDAMITDAKAGGYVLDAELVAKGRVLDDTFENLERRVSIFFKGIVVGAADAAVSIFSLQGDVEALLKASTGGRLGQILTPEDVAALAENADLALDLAGQLEGLAAQYNLVADNAETASGQLLETAASLRMVGDDASADKLYALANEMQRTVGLFRDGEISGDAFAVKLQEIYTAAQDDVHALDAIDGVGFGGVIGRLGDLWSALQDVVTKANEARAAMPGAAAVGDAGAGGMEEDARGRVIAPSSLAPQTSNRPRRAPALLGEAGTVPGSGRSSGGGGGGGGSGGRVEALLRDLQTEREAVTAWYGESLALLNSATEAQLAAVGGRHGALERLETEHQERLRGIRDEAQGGALANAETFFGAMATLTAAGGAKMARAARATAAAEALINTYRAQAQVLADPKLGFWAKLPAMAAIGAAGFGLVSALGGSGGGGSAKASSGAASGSGAAAAAPADPLLVTMKGLDPKAIYSGQAIIDLATALQKEFGKRGLQLGFVQ